MMKVCLLLALTFVAGVAGLQEGAQGEAGPEPYAYAYQTDSHAASEQRDPQGRVTGFYTLTDADGRERRVEYVADEAGFRAKVATNEVGTKSENPANVEVVAAEPSPAQYAAYTTYQAAAAPAPAPAPAQTAQYVRQQTYQTAAAPAAAYARTGYQYAYAPGAYYTGYAPAAYGTNYNAAYGGYGANTGYTYAAPAGGQYYSYRTTATAPATTGYTVGYAPSTYGYVTGGAAPAGQYYSYRSSTVGAPAAASGYAAGYRYRTVAAPAVYSAGFPTAGATYSATTGPNAATSTRSASYQGSSNYLVLQKRAAEKEAEEKKEKSS